MYMYLFYQTYLSHLLFQTLSCAPAMLYYHGRRSAERKILLRGDSEGRLALWIIPDINNDRMKLVRQESFYRLPCKCMDFIIRINCEKYKILCNLVVIQISTILFTI